MVALVRAGVTATCSGAGKPRYGNLARRLQPARRPHRARRARPQRLHRSGAGRGRSGLRERTRPPAGQDGPGQGVGARGDAVGGGLGARRRPARAARAAGAGDRRSRREKPRRRDRLGGSRPRRRRDRRRPSRPHPAWSTFESRTVALFNRGVPSFAVDTDGTLHTALLRSCTGWPSGTWIDEPRRTAPDGSNFQLQHWTHHFDYALVERRRRLARAPQIPARSAQFSHPLRAVFPGQRRGDAGVRRIAAARRTRWHRPRRGIQGGRQPADGR